jgi:alkanesulfonate monooxygenase SsuD/methylene tetrahydromethanopterin reductase-like flavin-dependent oxidoreductase (luciferase family)
MLKETVEIVKLMWSEPDAHYQGRHFTIDGAQCDPKPLQQPHPPIWIGGGGEQLTLRVVARHATHSNFGGKPEEWTHKRDVLRLHCAEVGRDPDEITMTWSPEVFLRETEAEIGTETRSFWGEPFESWRAGNLVGTPEQVVARLKEYQDLGCGGVVVWPSDFPGTETVRLLAEQVMPEFR